MLAFFDELADPLHDPDADFADIRERYRTDDTVRMPGTVMNALRAQEKVVPV